MGSLGAGLSLAVAASVLLLVVSTVVAFRGWPDDLGSSTESISRLAPAAEADTPNATPAVRAAPLALPTVSLTPATSSRTNRRGTGAGGTIVPSTSEGGAGTPSVGSVPTQTSSPTLSGAQSGGSAPAQRTTGTGQVVRDTTQQAADAVRPVAPAVGGVVDQVGDTTGDVVDRGDNAVADALGTLGQ